MLRISLAALAALMTTCGTVGAQPVLPAFDRADFATNRPNPYFPLVAGTTRTLVGTRTDADGTVPARLVRTIVGPGPEILGVATTIVMDEEFEAGRIAELTMDYYAPDKDGNVWYFGEDVTEYSYDNDGRLTGTRAGASWHAGVNEAAPGIVMPGVPVAGSSQYVGHAPLEKEMDYAEIRGPAGPLAVPAGSFAHVVKIYGASTADPQLREFRYWARGAGLVRVEEDLSEKLDTPAVVVELVP